MGTKNLLMSEIKKASLRIIILYMAFPVAMKQLPNHDDFNPSNIILQSKQAMYRDPALHPLRMLSAILVQGVIRVRGRLQRSALPKETKHPIILPARHHVTELIANFCYIRERHSGTLHTLASIIGSNTGLQEDRQQ